jgi:acyl-CoA thioesterase-1
VNQARVSPSLSAIAFVALTSLAATLCLTGCKPASTIAETPTTQSPSPSPQNPGAPGPASGTWVSRESPAVATPDTTTQSPSPSAQDLLLCFGDSLTAGYGTDLGQSYPDDLQRLLDSQGYHYHVLNDGISGNTTKDGLDRLPRVLAHHPAIVVVEFGGNDGLRGLPLEQTQANLSTILAQLQASGSQIVLAGITLPPSYGPDYIKKFDNIYPTLARQYHIRYIPFLLKDVYGVPGDMQDDATHATAQGNQQVARNIEALLKPLLKK